MSSISRRGFLAAGLAGAAAIAVCPAKKAFGAANFEGYPEGMGVLVDLTRCVGCRSCEAACNKEQNLPDPAVPFDDMSIFDKTYHHPPQKRRTDETAYTVVNRYDTKGGPVYRKVQCNHCAEPACLTSCFVNAYTKTKEGAVIYNASVCVGCRTCMTACPFYIPAFAYSSSTNAIIKKCILCYDTRLKYGRPPACVEACPQQVMTFGQRRDLIKMGHERIRKNPGKYVDRLYGEHEVGGTAWMYLSGVPFEEVGFNTELQQAPILANAQEFLSLVPMVLSIWPALFMGFHLLSTNKPEHHGQEGSGTEGEGRKP